ncbi:ATP-binding cassette domain-containing protein, partial [Collinsella sp. UBA1693]
MAQINTTVDGASAKPMVRIEGLRKSFGDLEVLRDVNLDIMPGEVVTIIGASGSGKSTLLRCINLLETPDAGHVWFQGSDLTADHVDVNKLREDIGMVFQGFNLFN